MSPNLIEEVFGGGEQQQDKKAKILERVRSLLAQADHANTEPAEADAFRAKADQLMAVYAIEQWEIKDGDTTTRPKAVIRYVDFNWFYQNQFSGELYSMFYDAAKNCRIVIAHRGHGKDRTMREIPLVGIPSDLDWFDLLFTSIMLSMANQLEPKPNPRLSFEENCYVLRMSGMNRLRIAELLWKAELLPADVADTSVPFDNQYSPKTKKALRAIRKAGETYANDNGLETTKISTVVWQRSFAAGFRNEVGRRLRLMARMREEAPEMQSEDNHQALVLRDIYQMALALYEETWPAPPPIEYKDHGGSQRRRKVSMAAYKPPKMSDRAINAGREAGAKVNLSGPTEKLGGTKKEIGS